jgi:hypothetical protein
MLNGLLRMGDVDVDLPTENDISCGQQPKAADYSISDWCYAIMFSEVDQLWDFRGSAFRVSRASFGRIYA